MREFLCDEAIKLRMSGTEIREGFRGELGDDCIFERSDRRRPSLGGLHGRHFADVVPGSATGDSSTIYLHTKSSSQNEVYVGVVGSLGDQRLTGRDRYDFAAIGQLFRQLTIARDKLLGGESFHEKRPTPLTREAV
jgi:hypothetical protein